MGLHYGAISDTTSDSGTLWSSGKVEDELQGNVTYGVTTGTLARSGTVSTHVVTTASQDLTLPATANCVEGDIHRVIVALNTVPSTGYGAKILANTSQSQLGKGVCTDSTHTIWATGNGEVCLQWRASNTTWHVVTNTCPGPAYRLSSLQGAPYTPSDAGGGNYYGKLPIAPVVPPTNDDHYYGPAWTSNQSASKCPAGLYAWSLIVNCDVAINQTWTLEATGYGDPNILHAADTTALGADFSASGHTRLLTPAVLALGFWGTSQPTFTSAKFTVRWIG